MLFELAKFHAFAKLRLHTDDTLSAFEDAVASLGVAMRRFLAKVCPFFDTRELPKETDSRKRRKQASGHNATVNLSAKSKVFNLGTYKYHRLGDYPAAVREFGTLDSFSTVTVSHWC